MPSGPLISAFAAALLAGAVLPATSLAVSPAYLVPVNTPYAKFGPFEQRTSSDADELRRVFGEPDVVRRTKDFCFLRWRAIGATVVLSNFGQEQDPCTNVFIQARLDGPRWRTQFGVGPGVSAKVAARRAIRPCREWWECGGRGTRGFVYRTDRSDCSATPKVTVSADVRRGRVAALNVFSHGCE